MPYALHPVGATWQRRTGGCNAVNEEGAVLVKRNEAPSTYPRLGGAMDN